MLWNMPLIATLRSFTPSEDTDLNSTYGITPTLTPRLSILDTAKALCPPPKGKRSPMNTTDTTRSPLRYRILSAIGVAAIALAIVSMVLTGQHTSDHTPPLAASAPALTAPTPTTTVDTNASTPATADADVDLVASKHKVGGQQYLPITSSSGRTLRNHRPKSGSTVERKTPTFKVRKSSTHTKPLVTH